MSDTEPTPPALQEHTFEVMRLALAAQENATLRGYAE